MYASGAASICGTPSGYVSLPGDCDDTSTAYNPAATEVCTDPNDYNCDGSVGYADHDGDGENDDEDEGAILCCLPGADAATSDDPEVECEDVSALDCATQGGTVTRASAG